MAEVTMTPFLWVLLVASVIILGWILINRLTDPVLGGTFFEIVLLLTFWTIFPYLFIKERGTSNRPMNFEDFYIFFIGLAFFVILFLFTRKK